ADAHKHWYPWEDKIMCTLDILTHLPRSVFSRRQLDLFLWLLQVNGVDYVPSSSSLKRAHIALQKIVGIRTIRYAGALGNPYYANSMGDIIAQMSNPRVRPHLHFYPEDSGTVLSETRQASRWLHEISDDLLTPMANIDGQRFFIHELAKLKSGQFCVPVRWFSRRQGTRLRLFAKCWNAQDVVHNESGAPGWIVSQSDTWEVPLDNFMIDWKRLCEKISGYFNLESPHELQPWLFTVPEDGNRWRVRSQGRNVYSFPIWMYCDDTSGNLSKRWNEHNSLLFILAGLPREQAQKEFNIHFLSTSNTAPPLEMLDGIVDQLNDLQKDGVWAWDCVDNSPVLIFPVVMALLGDNPMQSEFSAHIGLRGRMFCRMCYVSGKVEGTDVVVDESGQDRPFEDSNNQTSPPPSLALSARSVSSIGSESPARLRDKDETTTKLQSYFTDVTQELNVKMKIKAAQTESGIKDAFQEHFLQRIFAAHLKVCGKDKKKRTLEEEVRKLPSATDWHATASPVWHIKGLDPHQDTPVEVLHVVLLGFIKYFWRDAVNNQIGKDAVKRELLKTRINGVDVHGLGLNSQLSGHTLVQFAGSLTGADFRAIAQIAPFVLQGLVSDDCFATWVALSKLVPMIWQPVIPDIHVYKPELEKQINHFLLTTARWNCRWFLKPKFHIIVHLPRHIERFGPAMLFATEGFESFNAVIRVKSVHSNRQAPSRDIALAFAQCNRVRHILSGGLFLMNLPASIVAPTAPHPFSFQRQDWKGAGDGPKGLIAQPNTVTDYLGLEKSGNTQQSDCSPMITPSRGVIHLGAKACLLNGDMCRPGAHVVLTRRSAHASDSLHIAKVLEIYQHNSPVPTMRLDGFLLQMASTHRVHETYEMPHIDLQDRLYDILCTVNVQHDCATHACTDSGTTVVLQERQATAKTKTFVEHREPAALVLNTGQMRDAVHLRPFMTSTTPLDKDMVMHYSADKERRFQATQLKRPDGRDGPAKKNSRPAQAGGRQGRPAAPSLHPRVSALHE
ncbi:hypothetical protein FISHEDRAFT_33763, partial [Fistulina hepatica ATCC 64428]